MRCWLDKDKLIMDNTKIVKSFDLFQLDDTLLGGNIVLKDDIKQTWLIRVEDGVIRNILAKRDQYFYNNDVEQIKRLPKPLAIGKKDNNAQNILHCNPKELFFLGNDMIEHVVNVIYHPLTNDKMYHLPIKSGALMVHHDGMLDIVSGSETRAWKGRIGNVDDYEHMLSLVNGFYGKLR